MSNETLDSLRGIWNDVQKDSSYEANMLHAELNRQWKERNRKLMLKFIIELGIYLVIYTSAIITIVQTSANLSSQLFGIKIVVLSLLFFTPVGISLFQSLAYLRKVNFNISITDYVDESIHKLIKSKKLYLRYSYLFSGFMMAMLLTDDFFMSHSQMIKVLSVGFVVMTTLLIKPYLNITYDKDIRRFQQIKKEMGDTSA